MNSSQKPEYVLKRANGIHKHCIDYYFFFLSANLALLLRLNQFFYKRWGRKGEEMGFGIASQFHLRQTNETVSMVESV